MKKTRLRAIKCKSLAHVIYVVWDSEPTTTPLLSQPFIRMSQHTYLYAHVFNHLNFQFHAHHSDKMVFDSASEFNTVNAFVAMQILPKKCNLLRKNLVCIVSRISWVTYSIVKMHWSVTLFIISIIIIINIFRCGVVCGIVDLDVTWNGLYQFEEIIFRLTHSCQSASMTKKETTLKGQNGPSILEEKWFLFAFISTWTLTFPY